MKPREAKEVLEVQENNFLNKMASIRKAQETKKFWAMCLKRKLLPEILSCYDKNFIFKGTLVKKATQNKYDLSKYFKNFVNKANDVTFFKNNITLEKNNIVIDTGRYNFKTDDGIIKAQYTFIFDKDGKIIMHYSNLY